MRDELLEILPRLRRFAFALTGDRHDADDLLQNTIERLLVKIMPQDAELQRWAFTVCRNIWIDETRKRKVREASDIDDMHTLASGDHAENQAMTRMTLKQVNAAMHSLPEQLRATLSMVSVGGMSYQEAAHALEVPIGTVMSRVSRARKQLIERLDTSPVITETQPGRGANELH